MLRGALVRSFSPERSSERPEAHGRRKAGRESVLAYFVCFCSTPRDWDVAASWDDGATWAGWLPTEKSPGSCGEGGGGTAMGSSQHQVMRASHLVLASHS